jgi:hypothetical protein
VVELGVPAALADGSLSTAQAAQRTGTDPTRLERLLCAMRAANMVTLADERWTLTDDGRALAPTAPGEQETLAAYAEYTRRATFTAWAGLAKVITRR